MAVKVAFNEFHRQYRDRISDLVAAFPENARVTVEGEDKGAFWSGSKRFPSALDFDVENDDHFSYIFNFANLVLFAMHEAPKTPGEIRNALKGLKPPVYKAKDIKSAVESEEAGEDDGKTATMDDDEDATAVTTIKAYLKGLDLSKFKPLQVADFEKDDDTNFHIDFIRACANLRAINYRIQQASRHKVKMIAGKIIPALATTTAMITGLVSLELYKLLLGLDVDKFKNSFCNLGISQMLNMAEPMEPKRTKSVDLDPVTYMPIKAIPEGFSTWDKIKIDAKGKDLTVEEFCHKVAEAHFNVKVNLLYKDGLKSDEIASGKGQPIYNRNQYLAPEVVAKMQANYKTGLLSVYRELYGDLPRAVKYLLLDCDC
eukprot:GABV01000597.1.p1 GENE.GABV01000597.1~~GABV01000597.1.p1  ORF type:complete len:400 (-),score=152.82 GABV01000597.1:17-1132(-)